MTDGLVEHNDWEHLTYTWNGRPLVLPAVAVVHWPNGTASREALEMRTEHRPATDNFDRGGTRKYLALRFEHHGHVVYERATLVSPGMTAPKGPPRFRVIDVVGVDHD